MRGHERGSEGQRRLLALGLACGALLFLLVATTMTTEAYVNRKTHSSLDDFGKGSFHRTGLLEIPDQEIESVQLTPIGLFGSWQAGGTLPVALTELCAVAQGGHVVVMGGIDTANNKRSEVYVSAIGQDGALGSWVEQMDNPLPQAVSSAASAIHPADADSSWIYVLGGVSDSGRLDTVYRTTLHHDTGTIDPWITSTQHLTTPTYYLGATAHNGYLYAVGGHQVVPPFNYTTHEVLFAEIQSDGSLGPWTLTNSLPEDEPLSTLLAVAYSETTTNTLYVVGGVDRNDVPDSSSFHVFFSDINTDGTLTPWQRSVGNLPTGIYAHSGILLNDQIFVTGGRDSNNERLDTVKAALVDPGNPTFRLYDWCLGVPPPSCTIGAWQTGPVLPEARAYHVTVSDQGFIYTLGGVDESGTPSNQIFRGSTTEPGAIYAPSGYYLSPRFSFEAPSALRKLEWDATIAYPSDQTLAFRYRYKRQGRDWEDWSVPVPAVDGLNEINFALTVTDVRQLEYRVDMTTLISNSSPLLNRVDLYYELADPEVEVRKDSGDVISVTTGSRITYTLYYTNHGDWVAEDVVLTETLPLNTHYAGDPDWLQVGSSRQYTYALGNLAPDDSGTVLFRVQVNNSVPKDTRHITNDVSIDFPTMFDALNEPISDPVTDNNYYQWLNPYVRYGVTVTKVASPTSGASVLQGTLITYTITYSNAFDAFAAPNAYILDGLPAGTTYLTGSIFGPGADDSNTLALRWDLGTISPADRGQAGYVVQVDSSPADESVISNTATIYSDSGPPLTTQQVTHTVLYPTFIISASKDSDPAPGGLVTPGSIITYTIRYSNTGRLQASNAVLTEAYDLDSYSLVSADPPPDAGDNLWHLGRLASGASGEIQVRVRLADTLPHRWTVSNQVSIHSPEGEPQYSEVITHSVWAPTFALTVSKTAEPLPGSQVAPGDYVTYTIRYSNTGDLPTSQTVLTEAYDLSNYQFIAATPPPDVGNNIWHLGPLAPGADAQVRIRVQLLNTLSHNEVISNQATLDSPEGDPQNTELITHTVWAPAFNIVASKTSFPAPGSLVTPGSRITYTIRYSNTGIVPASQVVLTETYDLASYELLSADPAPDVGDNVWHLGELAPDAHGQIEVRVQLSDTLPHNWIISNQATLDSAEGTPQQTELITHTVWAPALGITVTKTADPPPGSLVAPNSIITYTIRYSNTGLSTANQVVLTDTYDLASYEFASADPAPDVSNNVWHLGDLAPDAHGQIEVQVQLSDILPHNWIVSNQATLDSSQGDPQHTELITHVVTNPIQLTDLIVGNIHYSPSEPVEGEPIDVYATITNVGELDASDYFYVALYLKPSNLGPPTGPADHDYGYCLNNCTVQRPEYLFAVGGLNKGEHVDIHFEYGGIRPSFLDSGAHTLHVQVDVAFSDPRYNVKWGFYPEEDEYNNLADHAGIDVSEAGIMLPIVVRNSP